MIQKIKGTNDILPRGLGDELFATEYWQGMERIVRETAACYGYQELRTPVFEATELFVKGLGDNTDIVQKEMFSFSDRGERQLTLRPEGTASVVRSYLENRIAKKQPLSRFYYLGPMFRAEKPQKGRYRQFHQFGVECIGRVEAVYDVEVIALFWTILTRLGLQDMSLTINSVGCPECRPAYRTLLQDFFRDRVAQMCEDCQTRYHKNIMRMLDCKVAACQPHLDAAPPMTEHLCENCAAAYQDVRAGLDNLDLAYQENPRMVRGLDYYTQTAFEIVHGGIGAQGSIAGGGRYDGLIEAGGGPPTPAVGAAFGLERLLLALLAEGRNPAAVLHPEVFLVLLDASREQLLGRLLYDLRREGVAALASDGSRQVAKQLKAADRSGARLALFVGGDEWDSGTLLVKDLASATQQEFAFDPDRPLSALLDVIGRA